MALCIYAYPQVPCKHSYRSRACTTTTTSAPRGAKDGTSRTLRGTQTAATPTTPDARIATPQMRRKTMIIREIKPRWYRLDTEGLVFFGYSREHVRHKLEVWLREHDMKAMR
jgi:hypothetical protein